MSQFLFEVQQKNRLAQKGLLKRFSITCYGHQETKEEMKEEKAKAYEELKNKKKTRLYEEHFLNYTPKRKISNNTKKNKTKLKMKKSNKKTKRRQRGGESHELQEGTNEYAHHEIRKR